MRVRRVQFHWDIPDDIFLVLTSVSFFLSICIFTIFLYSLVLFPSRASVHAVLLRRMPNLMRRRSDNIVTTESSSYVNCPRFPADRSPLNNPGRILHARSTNGSLRFIWRHSRVISCPGINVQQHCLNKRLQMLSRLSTHTLRILYIYIGLNEREKTTKKEEKQFRKLIGGLHLFGLKQKKRETESCLFDGKKISGRIRSIK